MIIDLAPDPLLLRRLRKISRSLVIIIVVIVLLVLAGWEWDISVLRHPLAGTPAMNPLTAICFLLLCGCFFRMTRTGSSHLVARGLALTVLGIVSMRLLAELFSSSFEVDLFLFRGRLLMDMDHVAPARMSLMAVFTMILLASGMVLMQTGRELRGWGQALIIVALLPAFFSILGYLYRIREFYGIFAHIPMALPTAICCLLLCLALLFEYAGEGIMKDFTSSLSGGIHARLFIPIAIGGPVLLGFFRLFGYWLGLFSTEFGVAILVSSIILVFVWTIWYSARLLNKRDVQNRLISSDLADSEVRLQLLVNNVRDYAIFMLDTEGHIATWNAGAESIKGYSAGEVIGKDMSIFYTLEQKERGEPAHNLKMAKVHGHYNSEGWRIRKDGTRFWADIVFTALLDDRGELMGFAKITRDRTEYKRAQEQIAHQARLIEGTTDVIVSVDRQFHVISWNRGAEAEYGYVMNEVIGRRAHDVFRTTSTEEQQTVIRHELERLGYWKGEVIHHKKDGLRLHLLYSVSETRDIQGKVDGYVLVGRDISALKAEEAQLRKFNETLATQVREKTAELITVFERMSDGILAFDNLGTINYVNQQAAKMNKCRPEDLIGVNFWKRFPMASNNEFGENFHRAMENQQNVHFEMFSPSLELWIECFIYPSRDGLSLFFRDITENRKAEETVLRTSEELRQLASHLQDVREEERAMIAREIHDELGQQLTGIKMDVSWVARHLGTERTDGLEARVKGTLGLLDTTINTVRRIATELRPSILDDLGLVAAIEWQCQEFSRRSGIKSSFRSSFNDFPFEPSTAIGLFRICQESLTNVARHSGGDQVRIDLDWMNDRLTLRIRDNGIGLLANVAGSKKTLGLVGMRERAIMMGGELRVCNAAEGGLILEADIPLPMEKQ